MSGATNAVKNFLTTALRSSRAPWLCGAWAIGWGLACLTCPEVTRPHEPVTPSPNWLTPAQK